MTIDADVTKTRAMELVCRECGTAHPFGPILEGCPSCSTAAERSIVEVRFDLRALRRARIVDEWSKRAPGLWSITRRSRSRRVQCLSRCRKGEPPSCASRARVRLASGSKTRRATRHWRTRIASFHSVSVTVARQLGFEKSHRGHDWQSWDLPGRYAARAGLRSLIFHDPQSPAVLCELSQLFGARVIVTEARLKQIAWLVQERGCIHRRA